MNYEQFVEDVRQRSGLACRTTTEQSIAATLSVLGQRLRPVDARAVAARLPDELAEHLLSSDPRGSADIDIEAFLALVRERLAQESEERARATCQVLAEHLDEQARTHLRMQPLNPLFTRH